MIEKRFCTELVNDTRKALNVYERDGSILVVLNPGQSFEVESRNPETLYSRYSAVVWKADGKVSFVARTNWREPERGRWVLHCLNQDGEPTEFRQVGEERVCLPRGIPVKVTCPLTSDLIMFKELTIVRKRIMVKFDHQPGYLLHRWVVRDEKMPRPDSELKALEKILDGLGKS